MGKYKVSAAKGRDGASNSAFRLGKRGEEGTIEGRVGDEVELSDDQLKQLERLPFDFTPVNEDDSRVGARVAGATRPGDDPNREEEMEVNE
jgi:hypothetical protein